MILNNLSRVASWVTLPPALVFNDSETPRFVIESDATIVAPLMFAYVLGW